jgi:hypothetical protein
MLESIDRVQIVTSDRAGTAVLWKRLLGCEVVREDSLRTLGAKRTVLAAGNAEVELLEPDGVGVAVDFLEEAGRPGLFAVGFATRDTRATASHLQALGVPLREEDGQLFVGERAVEGGGFRAVISPHAERERAGVLTRLHEISYLVHDPDRSSRALAKTFSLDPSQFGAANSDVFGFEGVHAYLTPEKRDDVETITPVDAEKAMGRFFARRGPSFYMCFGESDDMERVRSLAMEHAPDDWTGPRDGAAGAVAIFLHPKALGGVMLGVRGSTV